MTIPSTSQDRNRDRSTDAASSALVRALEAQVLDESELRSALRSYVRRARVLEIPLERMLDGLRRLTAAVLPRSRADDGGDVVARLSWWAITQYHTAD
jgi:hypothetical protein